MFPGPRVVSLSVARRSRSGSMALQGGPRMGPVLQECSGRMGARRPAQRVRVGARRLPVSGVLSVASQLLAASCRRHLPSSLAILRRADRLVFGSLWSVGTFSTPDLQPTYGKTIHRRPFGEREDRRSLRCRSSMIAPYRVVAAPRPRRSSHSQPHRRMAKPEVRRSSEPTQGAGAASSELFPEKCRRPSCEPPTVKFLLLGARHGP